MALFHEVILGVWGGMVLVHLVRGLGVRNRLEESECRRPTHAKF